MKKINEKAVVFDIIKNLRICIFCVFAGIIYAIAIKYFIFPSKVIMTGTEGIAIATAYFFDSQKLFIWIYLVFQIFLIVFAGMAAGG